MNTAGLLPASRLPLGTPTILRASNSPQHSPITSTQPLNATRTPQLSSSSPDLSDSRLDKIIDVDPSNINLPTGPLSQEEHLKWLLYADRLLDFSPLPSPPLPASSPLPTEPIYLGSKPAATKVEDTPSTKPTSKMTSNRSSDTQQRRTLAEAKLARQAKRIDTENAILNSLNPTEKPKQRKAKVWKLFDFSTEMRSSDQAPAASLTKVESRVNVFRAPSQSMPLSRPVSRISSRTQQSTASESERRDSSFLEADDFQLFTGRRKGRPGIGTSEDRPSSQYATVEATFSKRAITEVFGNELPGPAFMDRTPGTQNGQLQFIQHPNGDVSAHQWSSSRFGWENIGQFSNIRKKIEGQLAASRLKGETASQAVQQNTLAYFRAVAKQREADVMGLPFGAKEIAACLPDTRPPSTAPSGPKRVTSKVEMPERPSTMMPRQDTQTSHDMIGNVAQTATMPPNTAPDHLQCTQSQAAQTNSRFNPSLNFTPKPRHTEHEDPFISATPFPDFHGNRNMYDPHMSSIQGSYYPQWAPQMHYQYGPSNPLQNHGCFGHSYAQQAPNVSMDNNLSDQIARLRMKQSNAQESHMQNFPPAQIAALQPNFPATTSASSKEVIPPIVQSKPASPLETRTAMREHVIKMGEQAKERTKSQANIRTVLYDPFQDQSQKGQPPKIEEPAFKQEDKNTQSVKQPIAPPGTYQKHAINPFSLPALSLNVAPGPNRRSGSGQSPFPTTLAPSVRMPFNSSPNMVDDEFRDSSPARSRNFQRAPGSKNDSKPLLPLLLSSSPPSSPLDQWNPEKLDYWLWTGRKFSRQNDFNVSIEASDATPNRRKKTTPIKPIAPPNRQQGATDDTPNTNFLTTRHLIPVLENLAQYIQGPVEKRRDYFCQWVKAPEWAIDRSANGNDSFFDSQWGQPPARIGRDPRYQPIPRSMDVRFGAFDDAGRCQNVANLGPRGGFGYGGRY